MGPALAGVLRVCTMMRRTAILNAHGWEGATGIEAHCLHAIRDVTCDLMVLPNNMGLSNTLVTDLDVPSDSRLSMDANGHDLWDDSSMANVRAPSWTVP